MERNSDRGVEKRTETPRGSDLGSKTPKADKIKDDTRKKISDNFKKR
jgi:hypothetical protein